MSIKKWHIIGTVFIIIAGTVCHYVYKLSGNNEFIGLFVPVNESIWEHLKLIYWPSVVFMIAEYIGYGRYEPDFFAVKISAIFLALIFVVSFFYTYSGVLGFTLLVVDILTFVIGVLICQYVSFRLFQNELIGDKNDNIRGIVIIVLLALCFITWTSNPPSLGIFWG